MKTTVIHHSADYDGIFCREIAKKFLPEAEIVGWDFSDEPLEIPSGKAIYVMDLPLDRVFGFEYKPNEVDRLPPHHPSGLVWIDHHNSGILTHPRLIPGYRIDGVAACRLAWQWFCAKERYCKSSSLTGKEDADWFQNHYPFPTKQDFIDRKVEEPIAVRLAGEYDIWDKRDPNAELFQHGLRSRELTDGDWKQLLQIFKPSIEEIEKIMADGISHDLLNPDGTANPPIVYQLLYAGRSVQYAQKKQDEFIAKNRSFDVEWEGLKFMAINAVRCNSLTFEAATRPDHDALMGFYYDGKQWNVSLYHAPPRKDLDLSAIAVKHGGGGHKGACGFRIKHLPFVT